MEEKKLRTLRLTAKALGIAGSALILCALILECFSLTSSAAGTRSVTLLDFLGPKMVTAFGLIEMAIVFSLTNFAIPQILTGSFAGIWVGFICREILGNPGASIGPGVYVFILSAVLILASGIVFAVADNKSKIYGTGDRKAKILKKLEVFCSASLGLSMILFSIFELLKDRL